MYGNTITLTFGDQAENHVGMQKIGSLSTKGFEDKDLEKFINNTKLDYDLYNLNDLLENENKMENCNLLVIKKGTIDFIKNYTIDDLYNEQNSLNPDKKAFMYGRVVNKHARYNLCFDNMHQDPDYINKKGTIISYDEVKITKLLKEELEKFINENISKNQKLVLEANYYYDIKKCGIGYHGDAERKKVIGIRLGKKLPLCFQWYKNNKSIGKKLKIELEHGDLYVMSEKTTGNDWKKSSILTLRHAAGCKKYIE